MSPKRKLAVVGTAIAALLGTAGLNDTAFPCGGLFCRQVPIDQAGEQIIFRQDGDVVTAIILIQYVGDAEDFSWVVPVPGIPELSTGSDLVFGPLESATRPQFNLITTGDACPIEVDLDFALNNDSVGPTAGEADVADDGGVVILERLAVGPFDVEIVSSDDAEALVIWLDENGYDLTDRGGDLIAPYVAEGKNFVALKLRQDQGVGDIEPLIMKYQAPEPCIPIRLTAVAAQQDMGVIVWLLGESRAVPLNYLHVVPNYTRLNWYSGTGSAYASYQGLITAAMDEATVGMGNAGGQGFATDYAGRDIDVLSQLPTAEAFGDELARLAGVDDDAEFIRQLVGGFVFAQDKVLEVLRRELPLPEGDDEFVYQVPELLVDTFSAELLAAARSAIVVELNSAVIDPLNETRAVFAGDLYLTRFFTTLSPEEMTVDPTFSFNPDLPDQPLVREATMDVRCTTSGTRWSLTLGPGTDRDGELVIEGKGRPPGFFGAPPTIDQGAFSRSETMTTSGAPTLVTQKTFAVADVISTEPDGTADATSGSTIGGILCGAGTGECGAGTAAILLWTMVGFHLIRRRR
ncbi:MAG: DUF2330 domain-containing protein [Planctomycetes bacterium]|nr:DUF2330 domain-containing protein [Planctomycetota bacterium]